MTTNTQDPIPDLLHQLGDENGAIRSEALNQLTTRFHNDLLQIVHECFSQTDRLRTDGSTGDLFGKVFLRLQDAARNSFNRTAHSTSQRTSSGAPRQNSSRAIGRLSSCVRW